MKLIRLSGRQRVKDLSHKLMSFGLMLQSQKSCGRDFTNRKGLTIGHGAPEQKECNNEAAEVSLSTSLFNRHLLSAHGIVQSCLYK